ncbi:MAG: hypothetical protein DSZ35_12200, partial [Verrucomicrobia bacterium]
MTITADDQTKEYLQANPALTLTYTGFQNGEDSSVLSTQATVGTGADASSSLGEYGIVVYGAAAANYVITHVDGTLTVEKNTIVITLSGTSVTYTGSAFAVTATPSVADVSVVVTYADAAGAAVASPTNAGTYTVSATADSSLYQGTQTGTLTIAKATATVTLSDLAATYDGSAKLAATTTVPAGLTVDLTYSQGSTLVAPIAAVAAVTAVDAVAEVLYVTGDTLPDDKVVGDVKTAAVAAVAAVVAVTGVTGPSNAGSYAIVGSVNEDNYSGYITGDLVIAKKALSATADALAKTYGSANPAATITYSGFENSEDATVLDTAPAATIGADATSGVGDYDITLSAGTDNNYEITTANGKLTVGKAVVAVTAADVAKIYGAAVAAVSFTSTGYVNGDDVDDIDTKPTVTTAATATSDVGTYATTAAGGADDNYSFAYTDGVLTISKATATIALSDNAADYDGKAHGVTVTTTPAGLEGSVTVKYDGSTSEPLFVASYAVTASMDDTNYSAADVTDTLTISQGSATYVTLADLPDVYYGDPPLDLGLRASTGKRVMVFISGPAVLSDDAARLVTINNVGTVDILVYALDATIPIEYRFQAASFEVKKRNLLITADSQSRAYGSENPALTYTNQGFAPGEGESVFSTAPALTTTATSASGIGDVAITFATEAVDGTGHYAISHQPGTLTVSKAPLTVTGVAQSRTYGDANPDGPTTQGLRVREYRDIGGTQVGDLTGNAKYPDAYDFQGVAGYFEWPQSGDINTKPAGNVMDNYGVVLEGYLTPADTASYEFYLAADDHAELWLSTDSDPANLVKIANEPSWNGVRSFAGTDRRAKADVDTITLTAPSALDVATTAGAIAAGINAGSSDTSAKVTATSSAGVVTITAAEANNVISIASEVTNGGTDDTQSGVLATATAAAAAVDAVAEVLYVTGDTLPDGKAVGDVKTAAVAAVAAKAQVVTYTVSGVIEAGDSVKLTITGSRLETTSLPIALTAGTSYYVRALMKEGGGGDNVAVTWIKSGEAAPANDALPIPGSVLTPASTITYAYAGFVNGEDASILTAQPSGSVDVSATTGVGDYDIVSVGAGAANYAVTHPNGKLTVAPATLTVRADDKNEFETVALPDLTYSLSGFVNGEDASVVTTAPSLSTDADNTVPGDYAIVPSGTVAPNYAANHVNGTMKIKTVAKPKVTGLAVSNSKPLVGDKLTLTASTTGDILTFEWYRGTTLLEGETSSTLVVDDIDLDQSGRYTVFANNLKGKARKIANIAVKERANHVFLVVGQDSSTASLTAPAAASGSILIREFHDIGGGSVADLTGNAKYPNSPDLETTAPYFEWPQSGDINVNPAGNVRDNYGLQAVGYIYPPQTANYTFYVATDDNSQVWLSTDSSPSNVVQIAKETGWAPIRDYKASGDQVSAPIALEAGKPYYINVLMKEGGGGDNMALAWAIGDAAAPAAGANPIEGQYLAPFDTTSYHQDYLDDLALKALLESQGFTVTLQGPAHAVSDVDPSHMSFVVISSTLEDDSWAAKYAGASTPIINLAGSAQDALGFIGARDELSGSVSSATQVEIVDAGHPLAGGLSAGAQTVLSAAGTLSWGTPNASAAVIATAGGVSHQGAVYGYEAGSSMAGGTDAAGRRVNLPFQTPDLGSVTSEGGALLVAAVDWVSGFTILDEGGDLSATAGDSVVLQARTIGDNITFQWYKNGAAIAGATSSSLDLGAVEAGNSGTYKVIATDAAAAWKYRFNEISYEVSVSARGDEVVLVTGADALSASDTAVKGILTSKGYGVVTATAADASAADLEGRLMAVVSPSVATSGSTVYENAATGGVYFASVKEFGDEVNLGLHNRLLDSLSFEYYGDFTADGDEKALVRIYANDGAGASGVAQQPGTLLYVSDPIAIAAG